MGKIKKIADVWKVICSRWGHLTVNRRATTRS